MPVIADSSVLIIYHQGALLWLLREVFGSITVPPKVALEVAPSLGALPEWFLVKRPTAIHPMAEHLDAGEREAISLAWELSARTMLLDDRLARKAAELLGFHVVGSAGVLLLGKSNGYLNRVAPHLTEMRANGLFLSEGLFRHILQSAGEA